MTPIGYFPEAGTQRLGVQIHRRTPGAEGRRGQEPKVLKSRGWQEYLRKVMVVAEVTV